MRNIKILEVVAKKQFNEFENVIHKVNWLYEHKNENDENEYACIHVFTQLQNPTSDNFVASENVTREMVKGWVESTLNEETLNRYNEHLDSKLNDIVLDIQ